MKAVLYEYLSFKYILFLQIYYDPSKRYEVVNQVFDTNRMSVDTTNNSTSYTITGLIPDTNYTVSLSAFTGAGEGILSNSVRNSTSNDRE